jgi:hypothetical protein
MRDVESRHRLRTSIVEEQATRNSRRNETGESGSTATGSAKSH